MVIVSFKRSDVFQMANPRLHELKGQIMIGEYSGCFRVMKIKDGVVGHYMWYKTDHQYIPFDVEKLIKILEKTPIGDIKDEYIYDIEQ